MNQDLISDAGMAKWAKKFSNIHLETLKLLCQELQCVLVPVDSCKKMMNRPDYAQGILIWVSKNVLFPIVIC